MQQLNILGAVAFVKTITYNNYMKKFIIILIVAAAIMGLFVCKTKQKSDDVVFWTLQMGTFADYINPIIDRFEKDNPDIKIKWIDVPYSEGEKRTLASILSNNPPDLVNLTPDFSTILAQKQTLHYIDCNELSAYNKQIMRTFVNHGKCYAVPFYATSALTFYNKTLYKQSKLKNVPATYSELYDEAKQIKENTGKFSTMPTLTENDTLLKMLNKYNINTPETLLSKQSAELFNQFKYLYQNDYIPKESVTQTHLEALEKYMSGQLVFIQSGANFLNMVKDNAPKIYKETDVAPQLTGSNGKYDVSIMNLIIPERAKNKEAALKFALYLTNKENQLEFAKLTTILPVNQEALNDQYFKNYSDSDVISKARCISAKQLNNLNDPLPASRNQKEIITLMSTSIQEIMLSKDSTESVLKNTAKLWKDLLAK